MLSLTLPSEVNGLPLQWEASSSLLGDSCVEMPRGRGVVVDICFLPVLHVVFGMEPCLSPRGFSRAADMIVWSRHTRPRHREGLSCTRIGPRSVTTRVYHEV